MTLDPCSCIEARCSGRLLYIVLLGRELPLKDRIRPADHQALWASDPSAFYSGHLRSRRRYGPLDSTASEGSRLGNFEYLRASNAGEAARRYRGSPYPDGVFAFSKILPTNPWPRPPQTANSCRISQSPRADPDKNSVSRACTVNAAPFPLQTKNTSSNLPCVRSNQTYWRKPIIQGHAIDRVR